MNRSELLEYFGAGAPTTIDDKVYKASILPFLQSDFTLHILQDGVVDVDNKVSDSILLQEFSIPDLGLVMEENSSMFGLLTPSVKYGNFTYEYVLPSMFDNKPFGFRNIGYLWYANQFDENGLLTFGSTLTMRINLGPTPIIGFSECRLSRPLPTSSQKSNLFVSYKQKVTFNGFRFLV